MESQNNHLPPVYAATYDHIGIILWGSEKLEANLDQELSWLERHSSFKIGWDHEAYTYDYLAEHAPQVLGKMKAGLARFPGRLGVASSTYGQPLSMFIDGESNIRQLTLAMETTEKRLGYPISVYLMSEHPFHAQLPQLLAGCGFQGAVLRTHFMMYGHNPEYDSPVGYWVGLDGTRLPALPTYPGQLRGPLFYHRIPGLTSTLDNRILTDAPSEACPMTLADFRRQFGERIQPLIATRADDVRNREELIEIHENDPGMVWILAEEIFDLLPEPTAELRAGPNEFKGRMPWGYCGNWMWHHCRQAEVAVLTAERIAAISQALEGHGCEEELEEAWKSLLVAQHHDIQICGLEDDARRFLDKSREKAKAVIVTALDRICTHQGLRPGQLVWFNPLPWEREEWVESGSFQGTVRLPGLGFRSIPSTDAKGAHASSSLITKVTTAPSLQLAKGDFSWQPVAKSDSLRILISQETVTGRQRIWQYEPVGILLTPFYEVCTSFTGGIRLLRHRQSGQVLLSPPKTSGTLAGMIQGVDCVSTGRITDFQIEPGRTTLVEEGKIGDIPYRSEWIFYAHNPRIDWRGQITFNQQWIGRPKNPLPAEQYRFDREDLDEDIVPGFNEHEYKLRMRFYPYLGPHVIGIRDLPFHIAETDHPYIQGLYWTAVSDGQVGLALFNRGQMGSVRESDGAFSSVLAFCLPYIWGTRVLKGMYTYELGILPFTGPWKEADLHRKALEYNFPFVGWTCPEQADDGVQGIGKGIEKESNLDGPWTPYRQSVKGKAALSALYTRSGKLYARFAEYAGEEAEVMLDWMGSPVNFTAVDLRERALGRLGCKLRLGPWQVRTVRFR